MRHVRKYTRKTCGRWRIIDGRRHCCPYDKGHDGDCRPYRQERETKRLDELSRLLAEHDTAECEPCAAAGRALDRGVSGAEIVAMRCDWASGVVRALHVGRGAGRLDVPGEVEMQELR